VRRFGEFKTPIGVVETPKEGTDITLVSGSTLRLVQAANELLEVGIIVIIDLQSLLPFDVNQDVVKVLLKQIVSN
jgi:pyruvate/2-oxoglutarate/acetoin dehydrogenase E1 component